MKYVKDINIFDLTQIQDKPATLYYTAEDNSAYMYVEGEKYVFPDQLVMAKPDDSPLSERFMAFKFQQDVKLEGQIAVCQFDAHYMIVFATAAFAFREIPHNLDVILVKVGNALDDVA